MDEDKDYLLQIKVKNAPLLRAMKRKGISTVGELSREIGISQSTIGRFANLKSGAFGRRGELYSAVIKMAEYLNVMPSDPQLLLEQEDVKSALNDAIEKLTLREQEVLNRTYFKGMTYSEASKGMGVDGGDISQERCRQIEAKAIRKLKHPSRCKELEELLQ